MSHMLKISSINIYNIQYLYDYTFSTFLKSFSIENSLFKYISHIIQYLKPITIQVNHASFCRVVSIQEPVMGPTTTLSFSAKSALAHYVCKSNIGQNQSQIHHVHTFHFDLTEVGDPADHQHSLHLLVVSHCPLVGFIGSCHYCHFHNLHLNPFLNLMQKHRRFYCGFYCRLHKILHFRIIPCQ